MRGRFLNGLRENAGRHDWLDAPTRHAYTEPMLDRIGDVVAMAGRLADAREPEPLAAVVGTAFVERVAEAQVKKIDPAEHVLELVRELSAAVRGVAKAAA